MPTEVLHVDSQHPDHGALLRAAAVLRAGGLVAFPTETVYGLGANALNARAVQKIFDAKGRPSSNPLIVHIACMEAAQRLVRDWPERAGRLAAHFWPGPLTIVLSKSELVPEIVTGGGPTVALRVPAHPVARELLEVCELPLAAPSANRSSELSPTRGEHVLRGLAGRIDLLLDAGATPGGLESTVIDLTEAVPRVLRPGLIGVTELEAVLNMAVSVASDGLEPGQALPSPGMLRRHYAPRTPLELVEGTGQQRVVELGRQGERVGWLTRAGQHIDPPASGGRKPPDSAFLAEVQHRILPDDPVGFAAQMYAALHELDQANCTRIVVASPPATPDWLAVRDRLTRGAARS